MMSQIQDKATITFEELDHYLTLDPFYGRESTATEAIISDIYQENSENTRYSQFASKFTRLPVSDDRHRHLIYLWCGLMGLPAYRDGAVLNWQWKDFLKNWGQDFDIRLSELKGFLRQHSWPLPKDYFPEEPDNTEKKVALEEERHSVNDYSSLVAALDEWFDSPLCDLPKELHKRIKTDFSPMPWDDLTAEQRRDVAQQWDYQHDPSTEQERQDQWNFQIRKDHLKNKIRKWELTPCPTALDLAKQEERLTELNNELATMEKEDRLVNTDEFIASINKEEQKTQDRPTEERDKTLQIAASALAKQWKSEGRKSFTVRKIAQALAKSDDWMEMTADRIERIIRRDW